MWSVVDFGKWKGKNKTLPQILVLDPDWFFSATDDRTFDDCVISVEAEVLHRRATSIKIPDIYYPNDAVRYYFFPDGRFARIEIGRFGDLLFDEKFIIVENQLFNMALPRTIPGYNKYKYKAIIKELKHFWIPCGRLTKGSAEEFFSDKRNFSEN